MKEIKLFECEICNYRHKKVEFAVGCEARGPGKEYPIGCIYGNHEKDAMYADITFAIAKNRIVGHANWGSSWACRDRCGDTLGESMCGGGNTLHLNKHTSHLDTAAPHFRRMVKWLRGQQIDITIWDGEKAVSYATYFKLLRKKKTDGE